MGLLVYTQKTWIIQNWSFTAMPGVKQIYHYFQFLKEIRIVQANGQMKTIFTFQMFPSRRNVALLPAYHYSIASSMKNVHMSPPHWLKHALPFLVSNSPSLSCCSKSYSIIHLRGHCPKKYSRGCLSEHKNINLFKLKKLHPYLMSSCSTFTP